MTTMRIAGLLVFLVTAGCAGIERSPGPRSSVAQGQAAAGKPAVVRPPAALPARPESVEEQKTNIPNTIIENIATPKAESSVATASPAVTSPAQGVVSALPAEQPEKAESIASVPMKTEAPPDTGKIVAKIDSSAAKRTTKEPTPSVHAVPAQKKETAASGRQEPPLDLKALEQRLKDTDAIGVFTKLTLKNQVDDLLDQFRAYYQGRAKTTLMQLRKPYEQLIIKVQSLLAEGDPSLAKAIMASREAIWNILSDPAKFAKL